MFKYHYSTSWFLQEDDKSIYVQIQSFAKEGLPINLREPTVGEILCNKAITKWGLERITCFSELHIWGDDIMNAISLQ